MRSLAQVPRNSESAQDARQRDAEFVIVGAERVGGRRLDSDPSLVFQRRAPNATDASGGLAPREAAPPRTEPIAFGRLIDWREIDFARCQPSSESDIDIGSIYLAIKFSPGVSFSYGSGRIAPRESKYSHL